MPTPDITQHAIGTLLRFESGIPIGAGPTAAGPDAIAVPGVMAFSTSSIGAGTIQWGGGASYQGLQFA